VKFVSPHSFAIGDTSSFDDYKREGTVEHVKVPEPMSFRSFESSLLIPYAPDRFEMDNCDFEKWMRPELLHLVLNGLYDFYVKRGQLPRINDVSDADYLYELVSAHNEKNQKRMDIEGLLKVESIDKEVVYNVAFHAQT
jgi:hypothetical protein